MFFTLLIVLIIMQRMFELVLARRNSSYLKALGAYEIGQEHYKYIVLIHFFFFISLITEVLLFSKAMPSWAWFPLAGFIIAQALRIWTISTLGPFWNTRIIILPGADIVNKGPYRFIRHPNYLVVSLEFLFIPLMFQAYLTLVIFSVLNAVILTVRIAAEERGLVEATNYAEVFLTNNKLNPEKS